MTELDLVLFVYFVVGIFPYVAIGLIFFYMRKLRQDVDYYRDRYLRTEADMKALAKDVRNLKENE